MTLCFKHNTNGISCIHALHLRICVHELNLITTFSQAFDPLKPIYNLYALTQNINISTLVHYSAWFSFLVEVQCDVPMGDNVSGSPSSFSNSIESWSSINARLVFPQKFPRKVVQFVNVINLCTSYAKKKLFWYLENFKFVMCKSSVILSQLHNKESFI